MGEFLQANWLWIVLGIGLVWFLFRRGGCGMGGHSRGSHEGHGERPTTQEENQEALRRHRGC